MAARATCVRNLLLGRDSGMKITFEATDADANLRSRGASSATCSIALDTEKAVLDGRDEFLRSPQIVRVVCFVAPRHRDHNAVMEIVIPERVQAITVLDLVV